MALTQDDINTAVVLMEQNIEQLLDKIDSIKNSLNQGKYVEEKYWKISQEATKKSLDRLEEDVKGLTPEISAMSKKVDANEQRQTTMEKTVEGWKTKAWGLISVGFSALILAFLSLIIK